MHFTQTAGAVSETQIYIYSVQTCKGETGLTQKYAFIKYPQVLFNDYES